MKNTVPAKPVAKQPTLVTQPSTVLSRNVRRYVAVCPFASENQCEFPSRKTPQLHASFTSAIVESLRHERSAHVTALWQEVKAVRKRVVRDESLEIVAE